MVTRDTNNRSILRALSCYGEPVPIYDGSEQLLEETPTNRTTCRTTAIILNRPTALNALTKHMLSGLYHRIKYLDRTTDIKAIILKGQGRAFCAGGDIKYLHRVGRDGFGIANDVDHLFFIEYRLNSLLGTALRNVSVIALLSGIVFGGGVGLAMHGKYRVATDKSIFAMPENAIGLHPDVGAPYILSRLKKFPGMGTYLTLTGGRVRGKQLVEATLATHYVPSEHLPVLERRLSEAQLTSDDDIDRILDEFNESIGSSQFKQSHLNIMKKCFTTDSVAAIVHNLSLVLDAPVYGEDSHDRVTREEEDELRFARQCLEKIKSSSPFSAKVSMEMFQRAKSLSLNESLKLEYRLTCRLFRRDDFYNGVRAAVVSKGEKFVWDPPTLADVSERDIENVFRPLSCDLKIAELNLDHDSKVPSKL